MLPLLWRERADSEGVFHQDRPLRGPVHADQLPVLIRHKEDQHNGRLRAVLLQQSVCVLAVVDRAQGQVHGSQDRGRHLGHRRDRDDDLRGRVPQSLGDRHRAGGGLGLHGRVIQGSVQAPVGQRQLRGGGLVPVGLGSLQPAAGLLRPRRPLLHPGGALGLPGRRPVEKPLRVFLSLTDVQYRTELWNCRYVSHLDLSRDCAECACECSGGRLHERNLLQRGPGHRHHHHRPGLPPAAAAGRLGLLAPPPPRTPQGPEQGGGARGQRGRRLRAARQGPPRPAFLRALRPARRIPARTAGRWASGGAPYGPAWGIYRHVRLAGPLPHATSFERSPEPPGPL